MGGYLRFQFLIGRLVTRALFNFSTSAIKFQFLIGRLVTNGGWMGVPEE